MNKRSAIQPPLAKLPEPPPHPDDLESIQNMMIYLRRQEWWKNSMSNTGMSTFTDAERTSLRRLWKAVETLRYHLNLAVAAFHRAKALEDEKLLARIAKAQGQMAHPFIYSDDVGGGLRHGTPEQAREWRGRLVADTTTLDALPDPVPGITALEAARQFGYSRNGAREKLERGVQAGILQPHNELRGGRWVKVYAPSESAMAMLQQKALPDGRGHDST